jgi:hypothetical protein
VQECSIIEAEQNLTVMGNVPIFSPNNPSWLALDPQFLGKGVW